MSWVTLPGAEPRQSTAHTCFPLFCLYIFLELFYFSFSTECSCCLITLQPSLLSLTHLTPVTLPHSLGSVGAEPHFSSIRTFPWPTDPLSSPTQQKAGLGRALMDSPSQIHANSHRAPLPRADFLQMKKGKGKSQSGSGHLHPTVMSPRAQQSLRQSSQCSE